MILPRKYGTLLQSSVVGSTLLGPCSVPSSCHVINIIAGQRSAQQKAKKKLAKMGNDNRTSWFDLVRRAFRSPSGDQEITRTRIRGENEQKQEQKKRRNWKWLYRRNYYLETTIQHNAARIGTKEGNLFTKQPQVETFVSQESRAIAVAMATTAEAAAAVKTAQAAVEVIRLSRLSSILVKGYHAAVVIQRIFRGYLARRALLALKGVVKLQALIRGYNVRKRAKMTLQCIQSLVRVQALVCDQRRRLSYEATSPCSMLGQAKRDRKTFISVRDKYQLSDTNHEEVEEEERSPNMSKIHPFVRKERNSYSPYSDSDQSIDSYLIPSPLHKSRIHFPVGSPKTPSSSKIKPIQVPFCSPRCPKEAVNYQRAETPTSSCSFYSPRTSMSESCCSLSRPNYMANTASTTARVKSIGTPRLCRPSSPSREQMMSSTKKRLLFPVTSDQNSEENLKVHTYE